MKPDIVMQVNFIYSRYIKEVGISDLKCSNWLAKRVERRKRGLKRSCIAGPGLQQVEVDLHASAAGHRFSVAIGWPETPLRDSFDGLFIQPEAEAGDHLHVCSAAGLVDFDCEDDRALKLGLAGFLRKLGLDFMNQLGRLGVGD